MGAPTSPEPRTIIFIFFIFVLLFDFLFPNERNNVRPTLDNRPLPDYRPLKRLRKATRWCWRWQRSADPVSRSVHVMPGFYRKRPFL